MLFCHKYQTTTTCGRFACGMAERVEEGGKKMKIMRELDGYTGQACLVEHEGKYYVVSSTVVPCSGPETLVFPANEDGKVLSWVEVAGGKRVSRSEAIKEIGSL